MDNVFLQKIIDEKRHCYFVSPHLDDAVLSAGALISFLAPLTKVTVVTVFTDSSTHEGAWTKKILGQTEFVNARDYFTARVAEDAKALNSISISFKHLGFMDAAWRTLDPNQGFRRFLFKYFPTHLSYLFSLRSVSKQDVALTSTLQSTLTKLVEDPENSVVFFPNGINTHVDHIITAGACERFPNAFAWADFPYITERSNDYTFAWEQNMEDKKMLILMYESQIPLLFPGEQIPLVAEQYKVINWNL